MHSAEAEETEAEIVLPARTFEQMRQSAFDAVTPTETPNWRMAKQIRRQRSSEIKEYVLRRANGVCEAHRRGGGRSLKRMATLT